MEYILFAVLGLVAGVLIGYFMAQNKTGKTAVLLATANAALDEARRTHTVEMDSLRAAHTREVELLRASHNQLSASQEQRHQEAVESLQRRFDQTIEALSTNMKAATEDMLRSRQQEFAATSQRSMKDIVDPLNESIERMRAKMEAYSKEQSDFGGMMKQGVETIVQQTQAAQKSAVELTTALKHDTKMQGDYGETILDEILRAQGFTEGIHYELQYTIRDEEGKAVKGSDGAAMRPDVLFHLDTIRDVIIDSKVNLTDFINFTNATDSDERQRYMNQHVASIRAQINNLSRKNYSHYHSKTQGRMDYVIMFVPISAAWWEALRARPSLWREAMEQKVYIADEQTLFAALSIIRLTWTQIAQVENQKEVFRLVDEMIDRVGQFMKSYKQIGTSLNAALDAYAQGEKKLQPSGQSILTTTGKLRKIGGNDSKKNPVDKFLDVDDIEPLPQPNTDALQ